MPYTLYHLCAFLHRQAPTQSDEFKLIKVCAVILFGCALVPGLLECVCEVVIANAVNGAQRSSVTPVRYIPTAELDKVTMLALIYEVTFLS